MTQPFKILVLLSLSVLLSACPIKNRPRVQHEPAKAFQPTTETQESTPPSRSQFERFDLKQAYQALGDGQGRLLERVLQPLSAFVLNRQVVGQPQFRGSRLDRMIEIFNHALEIELRESQRSQSGPSPELAQLKKRYFETVFYGCSRDLRSDCVNAEVFADDTRHTLIMALLAKGFDDQIDHQIKKFGSGEACLRESADCRQLVEERYRHLAMGTFKNNRYDNREFAFAYLKYARLLAMLIEQRKNNPVNGTGDIATGYLAESHTKIFELLIARYQPRGCNDDGFKEFVAVFNPWFYSQKKSDIFRQGARKMFEFAAHCFLYEDKHKTKVSEAMVRAMQAANSAGTADDPSFLQIVKKVKEFGHLAKNLGLTDLLADIERPNSPFFDEFYFVVDRLFRHELNSQDVEMILQRANANRLRTELPKRADAYVRIHLAHMIVKTTEHMHQKVFKANVISDEILQKSKDASDQMRAQFIKLQEQIDQTDQLLARYLKGRGQVNDGYLAFERLTKAVNRDIHYFSVYPQMMMAVHYLSEANGSLSFQDWSGATVKINAATVVADLLDGGAARPWFRLSKAAETTNRQMLPFAFEYLLSTEAFNLQKRNFSILFGRYLHGDLVNFESELSTYESSTYGNKGWGEIEDVCDYERGRKKNPDKRNLNFMDLGQYTYVGLGEAGIRKPLLHWLKDTGRLAS